MDRYR